MAPIRAQYDRIPPISIELAKDFTPSFPERHAIESFKGQVVTLGNRAGVRFDVLKIGNVALENAGREDPFIGLAAGEKDGKRLFAANTHILMGALHHFIDLEGGIHHEVGHVVHNNGLAREKIKTAVDILENLRRIHIRSMDSPPQALAAICEQFGTLDKFKADLLRFEAHTLPFIRSLEKNEGLFRASPEAFARLMETNDPAYLHLKRELGNLSGLKELLKMKSRTESITRRPQKEGQTPSGGNDGAMRALGLDLERVTDKWHNRKKLQEFVTTFSKAEEYVVDSYARQQSSNPESLMCLLQWVAKVKRNDPAMDTAEHPSDEKRIARLQYMKRHGTIPPDTYLQYAAYPKEKQGFVDILLSAKENAPTSQTLRKS